MHFGPLVCVWNKVFKTRGLLRLHCCAQALLKKGPTPLWPDLPQGLAQDCCPVKTRQGIKAVVSIGSEHQRGETGGSGEPCPNECAISGFADREEADTAVASILTFLVVQ